MVLEEMAVVVVVVVGGRVVVVVQVKEQEVVVLLHIQASSSILRRKTEIMGEPMEAVLPFQGEIRLPIGYPPMDLLDRMDLFSLDIL